MRRAIAAPRTAAAAAAAADLRDADGEEASARAARNKRDREKNAQERDELLCCGATGCPLTFRGRGARGKRKRHVMSAARQGSEAHQVYLESDELADLPATRYKPSDFVLSLPVPTRTHAELVADVEALMETERFSQDKLAQRVGVGAPVISKWLRGKYPYDAGLALTAMDQRVAAYLRDPTSFAKEKESRPSKRSRRDAPAVSRQSARKAEIARDEPR